MAKEFFKNLPDTSTPLTASRLNGLLNGNEAMGNIVVGDVKCKNLFNINNLSLDTGNVDKGTSTIIVNQYANQAQQNLKTLAPDLVAGKTYMISGKTTGSEPFIYLHGSGSSWHFGETKTITQVELDNLVNFYGNYGSTDTVVISEIQIEEGTTATEYTPYKAFGIESGSNSNGSWVKFEDGTMICRNKTTLQDVTFTEWASGLNYSETRSIYYPQEFIDDNVETNISCRTSNFAWAVNVSSIARYFSFAIMHSTSTTRNVSVEWTAIGRWK